MAEIKQKLQGVVAQLLNERELVVNLGSESGVQLGMKFLVKEKQRLIKDPETNEDLGSLQRDKVRVKVVQVEPRFCVARTYETYEVSSGGYGLRDFSTAMRYMVPDYAALSQIISSPVSETKVKTLRQVDRPAGFGEIDEAESYVQVGDPVVLLAETEKSGGLEIAKAS